MSTLQWHSNRLSAQIMRELSWLIANKVNDPRVPALVTPVEVRLSPDNREALIFISVYGDDNERADAEEALNHAAGFLQKHAASKIRVKHFPHFTFKLDNSLDYSEKINTLLEDVKDDLQRTDQDDIKE